MITGPLFREVVDLARFELRCEVNGAVSPALSFAIQNQFDKGAVRHPRRLHQREIRAPSLQNSDDEIPRRPLQDQYSSVVVKPIALGDIGQALRHELRQDLDHAVDLRTR